MARRYGLHILHVLSAASRGDFAQQFIPLNVAMSVILTFISKSNFVVFVILTFILCVMNGQVHIIQWFLVTKLSGWSKK